MSRIFRAGFTRKYYWRLLSPLHSRQHSAADQFRNS